MTNCVKSNTEVPPKQFAVYRAKVLKRMDKASDFSRANKFKNRHIIGMASLFAFLE